MPYCLFHNGTVLSTADIDRLFGFFNIMKMCLFTGRSHPDMQKYSFLLFCAGNVPLFMKFTVVAKPMDSVEKKIHLIGQGWNNVFLCGYI